MIKLLDLLKEWSAQELINQGNTKLVHKKHKLDEKIEESKVSDFFKKIKRLPSDIRTATQAIEAAKKGDLQGFKVGVNTLTNHLSGNEKKKREKELYTVIANAVKTKNPEMAAIINIMNKVNESKEPEIITQLRDVVKNGYKTLKDPKSGKRIK